VFVESARYYSNIIVWISLIKQCSMILRGVHGPLGMCFFCYPQNDRSCD
jgi:hypothetical protein